MSPSRTVDRDEALAAERRANRTVLINERDPSAPYYTPRQVPPPGTAIDANLKPLSAEDAPHIFKPLTLRGVTFHNRVWLSPLCQYSSDHGHITDWHKAHLGGILQSGPGLTMVEATAIQPRGRISPQDAGLWQWSQAEKWREIVTYAHSQGLKIGIQLAHAGRKASCVAPFVSMGDIAWEEDGGWPDDVFAPSAVPWSDRYPVPRAMTLEEIEEFKRDYVEAVKRAVEVGFDVIEIHNAHGYLLNEFLSPIANKRTDKYGGSFENRTRLTLELVELVRANIPETMPLLLRISASDLLEHLDEPSWTLQDTIRLAPLLQERGVDLIDISSGGMDPRGKYGWGPGFQIPFAEAVKKSLGPNATMKVSAVGSINSGHTAEEIVRDGKADVTFVGRGFQKNPRVLQMFGEELGVLVAYPQQIQWTVTGRGRGGVRKEVKEINLREVAEKMKDIVVGNGKEQKL